MKKALYIQLLLAVALLFLAGCGPEEPEVAALPTRTPRPTFTPTAVAPDAQQAAPQQVAPVVQEAATPVPEEPTATPVPAEVPTETPVPAPQQAKAVITNALANARTGPGTGYALAGTVERGAEFDIVGKNPAGDWYQICCLNGQTVWVADFLVDTSGPVDAVAVAADIPAPPPTVPPAPVPAATTAPAAPAEPTPVPAPAFTVQKGDFVEPRPNSSPLITFFGTLCKQVCPQGGGVGGYKLIVDGPQGRSETVFEDIPNFRRGDPGLASEFIFNAKLEIPGGPTGNYRAFVADMGGNQVSDAWEYVASGDVRIFLPRWLAP